MERRSLRYWLVLVGVLLGVEIGMFLTVPWATPFGALLIYVGMISIPFVGLYIGRIIPEIDILEKICMAIGLAAFLGIAVSAMTLLAWLVHGYPPSEQEGRQAAREEIERAQRAFEISVFSKVKPLVEDFERPIGADAHIRGKVMFIQDEHPSVNPKNLDLSFGPGYRAEPNDTAFTVVFVHVHDLGLVGTYSRSRTRAHKVQYDIYLVDWPEKTVMGKHSIISEPVAERAYPYGAKPDQWGRPEDIRLWVKQLMDNSK